MIKSYTIINLQIFKIMKFSPKGRRIFKAILVVNLAAKTVKGTSHTNLSSISVSEPSTQILLYKNQKQYFCASFVSLN